jgi:uncharacterized protein with NRDE domain
VCTLVAIAGLSPDVPLVVAANRDELYARAATPPQVLADSPRVVGGRDLTKGGTWLGATERGFFVGVTNQRSWTLPDPRRRSRGELVFDLLRAGSTDAAIAHLRTLDARVYNSFNLLFGDAETLHVAYARDDKPKIALEPLGRGVWVLNNDTIGSRDFPKATRAARLVAPHVVSEWDELAPALRSMLGDHELPAMDDVPPPPPNARLTPEQLRALQAVCVHTPVYGTRSSTLLGLGEGRVLHYSFADGPPCVTRFYDVGLL